MEIEFQEGSTVAHPNFERYMNESTTDGAVPLRFDCAATAAVTASEIAGKALHELERRASEEEADILPTTVVATRSQEPSGHHRYRVLAIARHRKPEVDPVLVREAVDPSSP